MKQRIKIEIEFVDNCSELNLGIPAEVIWKKEIKRLLNNFDTSEIQIEVNAENA